MRYGVLVLALCGCFSPKANQNLPCGANLDCPDGQRCDTAQSPPVCTSNPMETIDGPIGSDTNSDTPIDQPMVACTTSGDCMDSAQPFCDPGTNICRGCQADTECGSHVCLEVTGGCTPATEALFVSAATGSDANTCTTENSPCLTISGALNKLTVTRRTIRVANGAYSESFVFSDTGVVKISGEGRTFANTTITQAVTGFGTGAHDHLVEATGSNDLLIEGIKLTNGTVETLRALGGTKVTLSFARLTAATGAIDASGAATSVTLLRTVVDGHIDSGTPTNGSGIGVSVTGGASLTVDQCVIDSNAQGIRLSGQGGAVSYSITNTVVSRSTGTGVTLPGAVGATHRFDFNTIADNTAVPAMNCISNQEVRDTIFGNDEITGCTMFYSLFSGTPAAGNTNIGNATPGFVGGGDYHLTNGSPAINKADPGAGEDHDLDGDKRIAGAADIGADEH